MSDTPIFHLADAEFRTFAARGRFGAEMARVAPQLGARKLGFNVTRLAPGKVSFPYHFHHVNEELFVVLQGEGSLRYDGASHPVKAGDLICCPPGPGSAHQLVNDSDGDLLYLAISSVESPDIVEYPDSGKYAVSHRSDPASPTFDFRKLGMLQAELDYFAGEEMAAEDDE